MKYKFKIKLSEDEHIFYKSFVKFMCQLKNLKFHFYKRPYKVEKECKISGRKVDVEEFIDWQKMWQSYESWDPKIIKEYEKWRSKKFFEFCKKYEKEKLEKFSKVKSLPEHKNEK